MQYCRAEGRGRSVLGAARREKGCAVVRGTSELWPMPKR